MANIITLRLGRRRKISGLTEKEAMVIIKALQINKIVRGKKKTKKR